MLNVAGAQAANWGSDTDNIKTDFRLIYEHAKTSSNPHMVTAGGVQMVAAGRAQSLHVSDLGPSIRIAGARTTSLSADTKNYLHHLAVKLLMTLVVLYCSAIVASLAATNLAVFAETGISVFHPLLSVLALGASLTLILIATVAMFFTSRYFFKTVGWL